MGKKKKPQSESQPDKCQTHHCSDVSVLSLLSGGAGQTLHRGPTLLQRKDGHVQQLLEPPPPRKVSMCLHLISTLD